MKNDTISKNKKTLMIVLGSGGHTSQMIKLVNLLGKKYNYEYVIAKEDNLSEKKIKIPGKIFKIKRTREINEGIFTASFKQIKGLFKSISIMKKSKAEAIISCGPHIAIPICVAGKIFRKKIIFVESWSRIYKKSNTGKVISKFSDMFLVQWPEMKTQYSKAIYAGRLK